MAISKRLRYEILRRDNHTCRYCGASAPDAKITVYHVVPETLGGTNDPTNLVAACRDCNAGKSSSTVDAALVADVAEDAMLWRQLTERAATQLREERASRAAFVTEASRIWYAGCGQRWTAPNNADGSFEKMHDAGVSLADIAYAADATYLAFGVVYHWSYFCGIIWRRVRERDELAQKWYREAHGQPDGEA